MVDGQQVHCVNSFSASVDSLMKSQFFITEFIQASGTYLSTAWPYTATDGTCATSAAKYTAVPNPVVNVAQFGLNGNETRMKNVIFKQGKKELDFLRE